MRKNVGNAENRICFVFPDYNIYNTAIFFADKTVNRKGQGCPLVFFDAAVIVGVEICNVVFFVKGILFCIQTGRINMSSKNVHSLFNFSASNLKKANSLVHLCDVNLVTFFKLFKFRNIFIAFSLCTLNNLSYTFTLSFSIIKESFVITY